MLKSRGRAGFGRNVLTEFSASKVVDLVSGVMGRPPAVTLAITE